MEKEKNRSWARAAYFDFIDAAIERDIPIIIDNIDGKPIGRLVRAGDEYQIKPIK